jgi:ribonuclease R
MGKIEKIIPRTRNDAHRLIEECMLAANVCAADFLIRHDQPSTFRIHAVPTEEKLNQLRTFLKQVGLNLGGGNKPEARDYAELMQRIKERPDASLLQTMLLRSMQQAVYSPDNVGHFGLAYEHYAHFTSPIRRYPDLLTHRAIKAVLLGRKYEPTGIDLSKLNTTVSNATRKQQAKDKAAGTQKDPKDLTVWDALGVHCSANERRADEASRDVENWLKCYYMKDRLGEEFTGVVSGVTPFGFFVQLDELFVEGLVHVTGLGQDYFQYDEARHELRGERSGQVYGLTTPVRVQVAKVDLEARKMDLVLAQPEDSMPAPVERARAAAANGQESKPPRRRKAKAEAGGLSAAVPASPQQVHGMKGDPPVPPDFSTSDESEDDIVFVPPTRSGRGRRNAGNGKANGNRNGNGNAGGANGAAPKTAVKKTAAKKTAAKKSAPAKSAANTPSKTSRKKK